MEHPVDRLLKAIETGTPLDDGIFADDAALDATVPMWRMRRRGEEAIRNELARWYRDPGQFESLSRTPLPDGELVEYTLSWEEAGVPHACHQTHILQVEGGRIVADTIFCGGRWPAGLLAEMAEAEAAHA